MIHQILFFSVRSVRVSLPARVCLVRVVAPSSGVTVSKESGSTGANKEKLLIHDSTDSCLDCGNVPSTVPAAKGKDGNRERATFEGR